MREWLFRARYIYPPFHRGGYMGNLDTAVNARLGLNSIFGIDIECSLYAVSVEYFYEPYVLTHAVVRSLV